MRTRLGHYDIVAELGRGGMGVVYKGYEASLNRYVAIKVLADSLAHDEAIKERFLREARSMAALNDPHIIQIYFIAEDEGQTYFVMEFIEGESLGSMLKREHKLTVEQSLKVIQQTALGLATAHDHGVVHRDIKPGNLMITRRGSIKIADFGIALSNRDLSSKLTTTGEFVGTPGYLSPEVCLGKPVDQRSDIFSLGIVLFEMLTGKMPFNDESPLGLMLEVVRAEIPDVRLLNADVDAQAAGILTRMIAKEPADRYPSCHDLVDALNAHPLVAKGGPITAPMKISPAAATLVGQKTPVSGQTALPSTPVRTTPAIPTHITASALPAPPPIAPHQSVLDRPTAAAAKPRSSALQGALVTLLLLGLAGVAFAYRDRIPGLSSLVGNTAPTAPASTTAVAPARAGQAGAATSASDSIKASIANSTKTPPTTASGSADAVASSAPVAPPVPAAAQVVVNDSGTDVRDADGNRVVVAADGSQVVQSSDGNSVVVDSAGNASVKSPGVSVDTTAAGTALRIAKIAPPEKPVAPPKSHVPTVAVVTAGDDVISSPAEDALVSLLQSRGFRVIEGGRTHGERPNFGALAGRADAVVFVNARPVGTQQIDYYGQSSTLYTVQLGLKAYKIDGSVLWTGGTEQVNFTTLNAVEKARETIEPMLDQVDSRLDEFRSRGKRG